MSDDRLRRLLMEQRKRLVATILGHAEREVYVYLSSEQRRVFREKVLAGVDGYHALMLDILGVSEDPTVLIDADTIALMRDVRDELRMARQTETTVRAH